MPLTSLYVKTAKPRSDGRPARHSDSGGLYIEVMPNGARYWRLKYRFAAREKRLALGVFPEVSLIDARERRDAARKALAQGVDPGAQRKQEKLARQQSAETSFEAVARDWCGNQADRWTEGHAARVIKSLEADAFPVIGRTPVSELGAPAILETVRRIEKRGAVESAGRLLQRIGAVMRFAIQTSRATRNPATELRGALRGQKVEHRPALSRQDLPEFFRRLEVESLRETTRIAMRLLMLTFVRPGELRHGAWTEIDWERREWRIPAARMKMHSPHIVPLARQSLELFRKLHGLTGRGELMFPATTGGKAPMSENTLSYAMGRMGYAGKATPHGFRALASTILNEEGFDSDVIERQLAHAERNKVRAAYHRAEYLDQRVQLMQWYADFLGRQAQIDHTS